MNSKQRLQGKALKMAFVCPDAAFPVLMGPERFEFSRCACSTQAARLLNGALHFADSQQLEEMCLGLR